MACKLSLLRWAPLWAPWSFLQATIAQGDLTVIIARPSSFSEGPQRVDVVRTSNHPTMSRNAAQTASQGVDFTPYLGFIEPTGLVQAELYKIKNTKIFIGAQKISGRHP